LKNIGRSCRHAPSGHVRASQPVGQRARKWRECEPTVAASIPVDGKPLGRGLGEKAPDLGAEGLLLRGEGEVMEEDIY